MKCLLSAALISLLPLFITDSCCVSVCVLVVPVEYSDGGSRMYLLGPDGAYLVQVAGCVWVPEERIWAPEVSIVGEGLHFMVDDTVRPIHKNTVQTSSQRT